MTIKDHCSHVEGRTHTHTPYAPSALRPFTLSFSNHGCLQAHGIPSWWSASLLINKHGLSGWCWLTESSDAKRDGERFVPIVSTCDFWSPPASLHTGTSKENQTLNLHFIFKDVEILPGFTLDCFLFSNSSIKGKLIMLIINQSGNDAWGAAERMASTPLWFLSPQGDFPKTGCVAGKIKQNKVCLAAGNQALRAQAHCTLSVILLTVSTSAWEVKIFESCPQSTTNEVSEKGLRDSSENTPLGHMKAMWSWRKGPQWGSAYKDVMPPAHVHPLLMTHPGSNAANCAWGGKWTSQWPGFLGKFLGSANVSLGGQSEDAEVVPGKGCVCHPKFASFHLVLQLQAEQRRTWVHTLPGWPCWLLQSGFEVLPPGGVVSSLWKYGNQEMVHRGTKLGHWGSVLWGDNETGDWSCFPLHPGHHGSNWPS